MLSIIIPALNEEKYLPRLLESIRKQDYTDHEVIVSDADSADRTREIARQYGCMVVISRTRRPAVQRNKGAKAAKGDILLFLDADSQIGKGFLTKAAYEFSRRKLDCAAFYIRFDNDRLSYRLISAIINILFKAAQNIMPLSVGSCIMAKAAMHRKAKGFDESIVMGEDHDYVQRIARNGRFAVIRNPRSIFCSRRFDKEGKLWTLYRWLRCGIHVIFRGPIRKPIVDYRLGGDAYMQASAQDPSHKASGHLCGTAGIASQQQTRKRLGNTHEEP